MKHKLITLIHLRNIGLIMADWLRRMPAKRYLFLIAQYRKAGIVLILILALIRGQGLVQPHYEMRCVPLEIKSLMGQAKEEVSLPQLGYNLLSPSQNGLLRPLATQERDAQDDYTYVDLLAEGYRIEVSDPETDKDLGVPRITVNIFFKDQEKPISEKISFLVVDKYRTIWLQSFWPNFPKERKGRGRALLRHLLSNPQYAGYRLIAHATDALKKSFIKMDEYKPNVPDGPSGLLYETIGKTAMEESESQKGRSGSIQAVILSEMMRHAWVTANIHGVVPLVTSQMAEQTGSAKGSPANLFKMIYDEFRGQRTTLGALRERVGISAAVAERDLNRLARAGLIIKAGRGDNAVVEVPEALRGANEILLQEIHNSLTRLGPKPTVRKIQYAVHEVLYVWHGYTIKLAEEKHEFRNFIIEAPLSPDDLSRRFSEYKGVVYYPFALVDLKSVFDLVRMFPKATILLNDAFTEGDAPWIEQIHPMPNPRDLKDVVRFLTSFFGDTKEHYEVSGVNISIIDANSGLLNINLRLSPIQRILLGREEINLQYRVGSFEDIDLKAGIMLVKRPGLSGEAMGSEIFWKNVHERLTQPGLVLVSLHEGSAHLLDPYYNPNASKLLTRLYCGGRDSTSPLFTIGTFRFDVYQARLHAGGETTNPWVNKIYNVLGKIEFDFSFEMRRLADTNRADLCITASRVLGLILHNTTGISIDPGSKNRIEIVGGVNQKTQSYHWWLSLVINGKRTFLIDPTYFQFDPNFKGKIIVEDYQEGLKRLGLVEFSSRLARQYIREVSQEERVHIRRYEEVSRLMRKEKDAARRGQLDEELMSLDYSKAVALYKDMVGYIDHTRRGWSFVMSDEARDLVKKFTGILREDRINREILCAI